MTNQDVMARVHRANPVPSAEDLPSPAWSDAELLHVIDARREQMRELMNDPALERAKQRPPRWRTPVFVVMAAFVAAIVVAGAAVVVSGSDESPDVAVATTTAPLPESVAPTTGAVPETTAGTQPFSTGRPPSEEQEAVITAFAEAWSEGDDDRFASLFAPGLRREGINPDLSYEWTSSIDEVLDWLRFDSRLESVTRMSGCKVYTEPRVTCRQETEDAMTRTLRAGPIVTITTLRIEDGMITRWIDDISFYPGEAFGEFSDWARANHPDLAAGNVSSSEFDQSGDPEIALQLLALYSEHRFGE